MKTTNMIKKIIRKNRFLEELSYIIHNKFLYRLVNFSGGGSIDTITDYDKMAKHCEQVFSNYVNLCKIKLNGKKILEIGPGRTLGVAAIFNLNGADQVFSIDKFNCLRKDDEAVIKKICEKNNGSYDEICKKINYIPEVEIEKISKVFKKEKFDMIISNAVLEHVGDLKRAFQLMSQIIKPGGTIVHEVDLACHNRFVGMHPLAFLTFSNKRWVRMGSNLGQPNRFRYNHYLTFLKNSGFSIENCEVIKRISFSQIETIRNSLDNRFVRLSNDDLSVLVFRFSAKKR